MRAGAARRAGDQFNGTVRSLTPRLATLAGFAAHLLDDVVTAGQRGLCISPYDGADINGDLIGANLDGAYPVGTNLIGANFAWANLDRDLVGKEYGVDPAPSTYGGPSCAFHVCRPSAAASSSSRDALGVVRDLPSGFARAALHPVVVH